ncbi:sec-independent protein translocase protein TATB, chloroplastic [Quillaja saponaria]|uniref:Sec-independent protein translocase protein TATB, chloroplastic n=1 Tax=Quillaja saponaria TaxID=32244 RepID=A0AAD7PVM4_QUISA|nr:sec-independent protein translocase protein TATB, chloroplastic [Quillaja saponaria]
MTTMVMALGISSSTVFCPLSSKITKLDVSSSIISVPKATNFHSSRWLSSVGRSLFSPWNGLKHLGISITPKPLSKERKARCKGRVVYASLFGVGAPEALVIGVVALLVFGPKGLAEVARNLGKTLRAFQPTIRELQDVSREFKSTLEREIGLDDIANSNQNTYSSNRSNTSSTTTSSTDRTDSSQTMVDANGPSSPNRAYTTEDYLKITEEQLKVSSVQPTTTPGVGQLDPEIQPQAAKETTGAVRSPEEPESKT